MLERVGPPVVRFVAVSEETTDRVAGVVLGLFLYFLSFGPPLAVLVAVFGFPGSAR